MEKRSVLRFQGNGKELFGIYVINMVLTVLTLGIYAAWAKSKRLKYIYSNTEFANGRFRYHGEGIEIFKGFLKFLAVLVVIYLVYLVGVFLEDNTIIALGSIIWTLGFITVIPLAIHGGMKYRMSRTSWNGIHFGYRGDKKTLLKLYLKNVGLTIITLGIYFPWLQANLQKYIISHIRFGNIKVEWTGTGGELFKIHLKGILLTFITFGIYTFWYQKHLMNYHFGHVVAYQDETKLIMIPHFSAGEIFMVGVANYFTILFTLGLGYPWAVIRIIKMYLENLIVEGDFDPDIIRQTEEDYSDATGEGFLDAFDIGDGLF
ncbi:YjgN family protein [Spirochaeta cellobiosiphila]|uniref:YjgN family protein n=1 Tax=Spirochaeta cellobiosiphila TaxID=504483 RepID=UPI0004183102|nr:DUF898 family protein [Spirochaeta cellobiosiphila]